MELSLRSQILDFINYPLKTNTISQKEMWRPKEKGGIKLPNVQFKSQVAKAKWLIELASTPELKAHLSIFQSLLGIQKGYISGRDLLFLPHSYMQRHLNTDNSFYKEALLAIADFDMSKGISDVTKWDKEHLFYNNLFSLKNKEPPIPIQTYFDDRNFYTFGQFLDEKIKQARDQPHDRRLVSLCDKIALKINAKKKGNLVLINGDEIKLHLVTHHHLYQDKISRITASTTHK